MATATSNITNTTTCMTESQRMPFIIKKVDEKAVENLLQEALKEFTSKRYDTCYEKSSEIVFQDSENIQAHMLLAKCSIYNGDIKGALKTLATLSSISIKDRDNERALQNYKELSTFIEDYERDIQTRFGNKYKWNDAQKEFFEELQSSADKTRDQGLRLILKMISKITSYQNCPDNINLISKGMDFVSENSDPILLENLINLIFKIVDAITAYSKSGVNQLLESTRFVVMSQYKDKEKLNPSYIIYKFGFFFGQKKCYKEASICFEKAFSYLDCNPVEAANFWVRVKEFWQNNKQDSYAQKASDKASSFLDMEWEGKVQAMLKHYKSMFDVWRSDPVVNRLKIVEALEYFKKHGEFMLLEDYSMKAGELCLNFYDQSVMKYTNAGEMFGIGGHDEKVLMALSLMLSLNPKTTLQGNLAHSEYHSLFRFCREQKDRLKLFELLKNAAGHFEDLEVVKIFVLECFLIMNEPSEEEKIETWMDIIAKKQNPTNSNEILYSIVEGILDGEDDELKEKKAKFCMRVAEHIKKYSKYEGKEDLIMKYKNRATDLWRELKREGEINKDEKECNIF